MSSERNDGQRTEQQTPPTIAGGTAIEVDRTVQGTAVAGFAELRARVVQRQQVALYRETYILCKDVINWLDAYEADAKSGS